MPYPHQWWLALSPERQDALHIELQPYSTREERDFHLCQRALGDGWVRQFAPDGREVGWLAPEAVGRTVSFSSDTSIHTTGGVVTYGAPNEFTVDASPELQQDEPQEENQMSSSAFINRFLVGADPEFFLLDGETHVHVVSRPSKRVGYDHGGRVVELRPKPSISTYVLLKNIRQLLQSKSLDQYRKYTWRGGAYHGAEAIGGHVHFDIPIIVDRSKGDVVDALDQTTRVLELLDILPRDESKERRDKSGYGKFGAFKAGDGEERKEAGDPHMEYRTPASWLFSPQVAFCTLTALKLAAARPRSTLGALKNTSGFRDLKAFIEAFRGRDDDAARLYDKLLSGGIASVQASVDEDFKPKWQEVGF